MSQTDSNVAGYASLGADINKRKDGKMEENREGVVSDKLPELELSMSDEDLVKLTNNWERAWMDSDKRGEWLKQIEDNEKYWLGKQFDIPKNVGERPLVDNLIFESLETYLPQMTRRNPEPIVTLKASEVQNEAKDAFVLRLKNKLADLADETKIRLKLKKAGRHWAIFLLGVAKFGFDLDNDIPSLRIIRPKKLILDPNAITDEDGYTGSRIGEYRKLEASTLVALIGDDISKDSKKAIEELTNGNDATEIQFIEWWTPDYFCWKLGNNILLKKKNPHWNYDQEGETEVDEFGNEGETEPVEGINHFMSRRMPYAFLSVFNLGDQPMDNTSLIGQNLPIQDAINQRNKQIKDNVDDMNGGTVVSLGKAGLSQSQAKNVARTLRKGGSVAIPDGLPREAIDRIAGTPLPTDVYNDMADKRARLRDLFGVKGSSQAGLESERTVRGKIVSRMLDTDRIGGGVSEYLEQFADEIYNWFVQLLYVYDREFQLVRGGTPPKLLVSVKEGSLLPKDSISLANQAIELAIAGKLSLVDLFEKLEYPDPEELAANVWLEVNAPHLLYKDNPLVQEATGQLAATQPPPDGGQGPIPAASGGFPAIPNIPAQGEELPETVAAEGL